MLQLHLLNRPRLVQQNFLSSLSPAFPFLSKSSPERRQTLQNLFWGHTERGEKERVLLCKENYACSALDTILKYLLVVLEYNLMHTYA